MKIIALTIVVLIALIASGGSLPSKQPGVVISHVSDHRNTDPFHGSEVGATLVRACGNCHSNQTVLPWYGHVAPVSWWIHRHLREGREELNFSEWTTYSAQRRRSELESICGVISNGRMPPASYRVLHSESRLQAQDKEVICAWAANESEHEK
jgi:Haem-binding domain